MQIKTFVVAVAGLAANVQATMSAAQVIVNINAVTNLSAKTNDVASSISYQNIFTTGVTTVNNFRQIVQIVTTDIQAMAGAASQKVEYSVSDQQGVCDAFRNFVVVHQKLLATVIGKKSFFAATPFTAPVAAVLRAVEGGVDTLAFGIIDSVPSCAADATKDKNSLDASLNQSITVYSS